MSNLMCIRAAGPLADRRFARTNPTAQGACITQIGPKHCVYIPPGDHSYILPACYPTSEQRRGNPRGEFCKTSSPPTNSHTFPYLHHHNHHHCSEIVPRIAVLILLIILLITPYLPNPRTPPPFLTTTPDQPLSLVVPHRAQVTYWHHVKRRSIKGCVRRP